MLLHVHVHTCNVFDINANTNNVQTCTWLHCIKISGFWIQYFHKSCQNRLELVPLLRQRCAL